MVEWLEILTQEVATLQASQGCTPKCQSISDVAYIEVLTMIGLGTIFFNPFAP